MTKSSPALHTLPGIALRSLGTLGENLRIARERRGDSLRAMAERMNVSVPTLRRMESGDPSVAVGTYATALWVFDHAEDLEGVMLPGDDDYATRIDVARASRRRKRTGS